MKQRNEIDIHNEFCRVMQNAKEEYYREVYDAPEIDINKLVKSKRKRTIKRMGQIAAVFLVFVISSVFFAQEFLADNGYGKYIVQKGIYSMSSLDVETERLEDGSILSRAYIDDYENINDIEKFANKEIVIGYLPIEYEFNYCEAEKGENILTVFYRYETEKSYMEIFISENNHSSKVYIRGKLVEKLKTGEKIFSEKYDDGKFTITKIIDKTIVVIDGDGDYNEAIKVAENAEVK